jgi:hypothetical protein
MESERMPAKAVKRDEEVTITLSAIHWDALIRGEDRNYADHIYAEDGNGWLPYRSEAIAAVERATPGAAARRAAALAEVMERKEPFDTDAKRA